MPAAADHHGITDAVTTIAQVINDPVLIVLTVVVLALIGVVYLLLRAMDRRDRYIASLTKELHANSQTLVKLTTLIELMARGQ